MFKIDKDGNFEMSGRVEINISDEGDFASFNAVVEHGNNVTKHQWGSFGGVFINVPDYIYEYVKERCKTLLNNRRMQIRDEKIREETHRHERVLRDIREKFKESTDEH